MSISAVPQNSTNGRSYHNAVATGVRTLARVAPGAAEALVAFLFAVPDPTGRARRPPPVVPGLAAERLTLVVAGRRLRAHTWGEGPTVLLVHGWNGHAGQLTRFVKPLVLRGLRVVALDLPAHGESEGRTATLVDMAGAIVAATQTFGPVAGVVAHSLGATATALALRRGAEIERVVLLAPPAEMPFFAKALVAVCGLDASHVPGVIARIEKRVGVRTTDVDLRIQAAKLVTPALIFHAPEDVEVPYAHGRAIAQAWRGAELVATPGLGHRHLLRDARVIGRAVEFVTGDAALLRSVPRVEGVAS